MMFYYLKHINTLRKFLLSFFKRSCTPSNEIALYDDCLTKRWTIRWNFPFIHRFSTEFSRHINPCKPYIAIHPVNPYGMAQTNGSYSIVQCKCLSPPRNYRRQPFIMAVLSDIVTGEERDVTHEMLRLAGPSFSFFGFHYPLNILIPWLCECSGLQSHYYNLFLSICLDDDEFTIIRYSRHEVVLTPRIMENI